MRALHSRLNKHTVKLSLGLAYWTYHLDYMSFAEENYSTTSLRLDYLPPRLDYLPPRLDYLPLDSTTSLLDSTTSLLDSTTSLRLDYLPPRLDYLPPRLDYLPPGLDYLPPQRTDVSFSSSRAKTTFCNGLQGSIHSRHSRSGFVYYCTVLPRSATPFKLLSSVL